jgi:predicted pyridoxine 5'-phosphate oxidase superfamily flavin-nucleotide-binding protein
MQLTDDMKRVLAEQRLCYAATVCSDGTPNLSPKGTIATFDESTIMFADIRSPQTVANLRENPAIEVNVVNLVRRRGYRFKGRARVARDGEEFERALAIYESAPFDLERARERIRHIVFIDVERAEAVTSPAYDSGASEEELIAWWNQYYRSLYGTTADSSS